MTGLLGGLRAWILQRMTAVYMTVFLAFGLLRVLFAPPPDLDTWRAWMQAPPMAVATVLFFLALFAHAWVGVRDIVVDYVRSVAGRFAILTLVGLALAAQAVWVMRILLVSPP